MSELIETAFLSAIIVLPVLFIWSHLASRRQSRAQHKELLDAMAAQQQAALQSIHSLLEQRLTPPAPMAAPVPAPVTAQPEPVEVKAPAPAKVSEDKLMIIAAVLACQFGKRVKVRSARRVMIGAGANVWSQQGRAAVQASHSMR